MLATALIRGFSNISHHGRGRHFAGFEDASSPRKHLLEPRGSLQLTVAAGDLVQVDLTDPQDHIAIMAFDDVGGRCEAAVGLP